MKRLTGLDWPLLALAICLLTLSLVGTIAVTEVDDPIAGVILLLQSIPYAAAAWLVVKAKPEGAVGGRALATILLVALAMRCLLLPGPPVSTDLFRYIWDGRVQAAGINPYLHVPADTALAGLRDGGIYPNIDRADYAPTIYPPAAQIVFYVVTRISEAPIAMKAAMVAFEALSVWVMLQLLAARGLPRTRILLYVWHPLPLWEFARSGHVDIVAIAFLLLAFLAVERRSPLLAGVALGAGVLVKYFHVVTSPALYKRWDWRLPVAFVATVAVLYVPYVRAGTKVFGFLGEYVSEEGLDEGSGIFLWQLLSAIVPLPEQAFVFYLVIAAITMAVLAVGVLMRAEPSADLAGAMLLATAFLILLSPHYPWYFAWLVPFLCFYPVAGVVYLTCAAGILYFAQSPPTLWEALPIYGPCILILVAEFALRSRRKLEERHGAPSLPETKADPRRYFESVDARRSERAERPPVCVYLETTNRCNLLCTTCPRTYEELEPPADMSWELFTSIVDQIPNLQRAVLHGVGEPMLVKNLPKMVRYLKERGSYVLFNTNGTVLNEKNGRALIEAGLDELRVSLDAANARSYLAVRGKDYFGRILKNVRAFRNLQEREGKERPRVSAWLTGLKETIAELPAFVRVAADIGVREVYLQRLVFFERDPIGHARPDQALYDRITREEKAHLEAATALARAYGISFSASGAASEPGMSLERHDNRSPWRLCRRPWTVMYFTANGRALPCCIAPFSQRGYEHYTLGDATQQTLQEIWNGAAYRSFREALLSDQPPDACASCGLRWSL